MRAKPSMVRNAAILLLSGWVLSGCGIRPGPPGPYGSGGQSSNPADWGGAQTGIIAIQPAGPSPGANDRNGTPSY